MSEPQRIIHGAGDEVEAALLRSARHDGPDGRAIRRALAAIGVGGTAAVVTATVSASALKAGASIPPAAIAATASSAGISLLVKWVGVVAIGGLATWGVVEQLQTSEQSTASIAAPVQAPVPQAQTSPEPVAQTAVAEEPVAAEPIVAGPIVAGPVVAEPVVAEPVVAKKAQPAKPRVEAKPAPARVSGLGDEVAALDQARKTMADDPDAALSAIDEYQKKFGDGILAQEAEVLKIESLARAGKKDAAKAAAQAFLARHPSSPAAQRVRSLLGTL
jgi:hypothetical protein